MLPGFLPDSPSENLHIGPAGPRSLCNIRLVGQANRCVLKCGWYPRHAGLRASADRHGQHRPPSGRLRRLSSVTVTAAVRSGIASVRSARSTEVSSDRVHCRSCGLLYGVLCAALHVRHGIRTVLRPCREEPLRRSATYQQQDG